MNFGELIAQEVEMEQAKGINSNFNACVYKDECCKRVAMIEQMQARIDELMMEFCPDEMTLEQVANWQHNQSVLPNTPMRRGKAVALNGTVSE